MLLYSPSYKKGGPYVSYQAIATTAVTPDGRETRTFGSDTIVPSENRIVD